MAGKKFKFDVSVPAAAIATEELKLDFSGYNRRGQKFNAYRVKSFKIQIDDLDAEAADDILFKFQLSYESQAAGSHAVISDKDEIMTLAQIQDTMTAVNAIRGNLVADEIRAQGKIYIDGRDFTETYIVKEKAYANFSNGGQDATEIFHCILTGNYVHLDEDDLKAMQTGVTLT